MSLDVLQGRPTIEDQPSGLRKITRFRKLNGEGAKTANISTYLLAYGTADAEFTTALLVDQRIERRSEQGIDLTIVQVFQELADNALTATTEVSESTAFDGRRVTRTTYLCKASQAASLRPAIGSGSPAVFQVDIEETGPVAKVITSAIEVTDAGFVLSDVTETKNNGGLTLRSIRTVGAAPSIPSGFTAVQTSTQAVDGYTVYSYSFAKGSGEISRSVDYRQSNDQGTTGVTVTVIRHLTASSVGSDPTSLGGSVKVGEDNADQDGFRIWTITYAKGTGTVVDETSTRSGGKLKVYHRVALGSAPSAPTATISGTVTVFDASVRKEEGFDVYDYRWAEGNGSQASIRSLVREDGSIVYTVTDLNSGAATPSYPGSGTGYLTALDQSAGDGHWTNHATYIKPPADFTVPVQVAFHMPGLVTAANPPTVVPPVTLTKMGTDTVTFSTTQTSSTPYTISAYASLYESYTRTADGLQFSQVKELPGYLGSSTLSGSSTTYRGIEVDAFVVEVSGSSPTSLPSGSKTVDVQCDLYLTAMDGTRVWRNRVVTVTV